MLAAALVKYSVPNNLILNSLSAFLLIFLLLYINHGFDKTEYVLVYYCIALLKRTKGYDLAMNKFVMEIRKDFYSVKKQTSRKALQYEEQKNKQFQDSSINI